jgi:hypothetical protein
MKFGNRRKKDPVVGRPLMEQDGFGGSVLTDYAHGRPSPVSWEYQPEPLSAQKKGLLKKLNCGASSKHDRYDYNDDDDDAFYGGYPGVSPYRPEVSPAQEQQLYPSSRNGNRNDSVRPVLITVKDGDMKYQRSTNEPRQTLEFKSTFLVGPEGESPEARRLTPRRSPRKEPKRSVVDPRRKSPERRRRSKSTNRSSFKEQEEKEVGEEERKNRWRKGVQTGLKDDGDLGSKLTFGEESTYADTTSNSDSYESDSYGSSGISSRNSSKLSNGRGRGRRRSKSRNSRNRRSKSLTNNKSVLNSVAEDLGVVAKMIFSDGTACFSSAAEITRETIVSCKTQV